MKFFKSIRWQLQMWHGLLLLAVISAFGFTAFQLEKSERLQSLDAELQHRLSLLVNSLRSSPRDEPRRPRQGGPPDAPQQFDERTIQELVSSSTLRSMFGPESGYYFVIWMRGPNPIARSTNAPADLPRPTERNVVSRVRPGGYREAFIFAAPVDCVLIGRSTDDVNAAIMFHSMLLAGAGLVLLSIGLAVGWWLTNRSLRPVRDISTTAASIAGGDLSQRINTSETGSELGELACLLNSTFARLDAAFAQQARFTSDAAHELRTPLTVLLTQTQAALARERTAAEYRAALMSNQSTAQRMRRLVESLLELARFDAGQEPLRREPYDLADGAAGCVEHMRPLADARGIEIQLDLQEAQCLADPDHISQVITNLVKNAIDYNRESGKIHISTHQRNGLATLEVTDTGVGIPEEHLPHIFERFYRADASRSNGSRGNGLGLAISKAIIDAHSGVISAHNHDGGGTTFVFALQALKV